MAVTGSARGPTILDVGSASVKADDGSCVRVPVVMCCLCGDGRMCRWGSTPPFKLLLHSAGKHKAISPRYALVLVQESFLQSGRLENEPVCSLTCNFREETFPMHAADLPGSLESSIHEKCNEAS